MAEKIVVGRIDKGLRNDVTPFNIDNDSFPTLINAYQWRGRVKRKRGTSFLGRLTRYFNSTSVSYNTGSTTITLDGSGVGNILTGFSLQANGNIVPGSVTITVGANVYTDPDEDGILQILAVPAGTINYATGEITIAAEASNNASAIFRYYPDLPVMGLEDLILDSTQFPGTLGFDTTYAYNISTADPYPIHSVSFYKNPATASYSGYTRKTNSSPVNWNGQDYQQFWTVNYQGALWACNGISIPFSVTNVGMQYKPIVSVTVTSGTTATLQITAHGLAVGDFVFVNEVVTTTGINWQTGYVTTVTNANNVVVTFPNASLATNGTGGIAQYLTRSADATKDCIRFYDGDPTDGSETSPALTGTKGWVNFTPPLSQAPFPIADLPPAVYYLVGARMIVPFKDRLLFLGPVVQTSAAGSQVYLQDTIIYSENGTPYYTASYTNSPTATVDTPTSATNVFNPILTPQDQQAIAPAYFSDSTGFGGFISAGIQQPMITVSSNEDVLIIGFSNLQTRLIYTGNDIIPFNIFVINAELGSGSTFSSVTMDQGVLTRGNRGFVITSQTQAQRFDLAIPDEAFQMRLTDNGSERMCAARDFINEWAYFTFPCNTYNNKYPTETLQYNYRDNSWAVFYETYTTYGQFKRRTGFTWGTVGRTYPTWADWNEPWNAGDSSLLQPEVIAGNQQGFVVFRSEGTGESKSLYIRSFSGNTITCPSHSLNTGDYIYISGCLGTVGDEVNGNIYSVLVLTTDTFTLNPSIGGAGTYLGGGLIERLYVPFIQTKQFPTAWGLSRKTRIGAQQYLLSTTDRAQIQLLIYLSQDGANPYNDRGVVPDPNTDNNSLIYSTVLYTSPESTNLGLTPANINLQMPTARNQAQTWHRMNTSLVGDTVQVGFTLSDEQMREVDDDGNFISQQAEIELHGFILDVSTSSLLA